MTIGIFEYSITQTKFGYHRAICTISSQSDIIATSDIIHCVRKGGSFNFIGNDKVQYNRANGTTKVKL